MDDHELKSPPKAYVGMTGEELRAWRKCQPGIYPARNGETREGWSQEQAADWYGCSTRQWQRYELGESAIPVPLVRRIQAHSVSWHEMLDRIIDTPRKNIEKWGGPFPELAPLHAPRENGDDDGTEDG